MICINFNGSSGNVEPSVCEQGFRVQGVSAAHHHHSKASVKRIENDCQGACGIIAF